MNLDGFYPAFEARYRGTRDLIKRRLGVYIPFIKPLKRIYTQCNAVDLGCGRGEWLELLQKSGFKAQGVDLDEGMLVACKELGLVAIQGEAIEHLKSLQDNSYSIISGFHVVEHIPFTDLQVLVAEALRVLQPGGLLMLETPNPENVAVGTANFYLDPTHQRPIPPLLLAFLPEYYGFERVKILRLQEPPELEVREDVTLRDVFFEASPDYAVVAQKGATSKILHRFNNAFDKSYGIKLDELADRYDAKLERRITALDQRIGNSEIAAGGMVDALSRISTLQDRLIEATAHIERSQAHIEYLTEQVHHYESRTHEQESRALAAEVRVQEQESRALAAEVRVQEQESRALAANAQQTAQAQRIEDLGASTHHWWLQANALEAERNALRQSWSWRITAPVRWVGGLAIRVARLVKHAASHSSHTGIEVLRYPIAAMMRAVLRHPHLSYRINQRLMRCPALHQQLLDIARRGGLMPNAPAYVSTNSQPMILASEPEVADLSLSARRIYIDLKAAIEQRQKEND